MKVVTKTFDLPLFEWACQQDGDKWVVIDETSLLYHPDLKNLISGKKLLVHCRDAVSPFFREQHQKVIDFLASTRTDDNFVFVSVNHYPEFEKFSNYFYYPEYHAYYYPMYSDGQLDDTVIYKKFFSLNKREDPSRQLLYVKLYHDKLLDHSYFSYLGENNNYRNLYSSSEWDNNWSMLLNNVPEIASWAQPVSRYIKVDDDEYLKLYKGTNQSGHRDPTWMPNPHWYQTSFCSIVCETGPTAHKPNFSEKTFRAIMQGHPIIFIGAADSVGMLRDLGFDMYDDIIDHSYDSIQHCPYTRQLKAFECIDKIASYSLNELSTIKKDLYQRRINNIKNYKRLYDQMLNKHDLIFERIKQHVQSKI